MAWPWRNELFRFDFLGRHQETKSLLTDYNMVNFFYDEGNKLRMVINKLRSKLEVK